MIVASLENWARYLGGDLWTKAFGFIAATSVDVLDGRYPIDGDDLYASIATYRTRAFDSARYETHREYLDIQYVLAGQECMHVVPHAIASPLGEYDPERDVRFHAVSPVPSTRVVLCPGTFAVLYPEDAHMPGIALGNASSSIRKLVVKVRLAALPPIR